MFKLIESTLSSFIRFQPIGKTIESGNIVQLVEISDDIFVKLSDGSKPFGIVSEVEDNWIKIYNQKMICRTDKFDKSLKYKDGAMLYVKDGILTLNKNYYPVGNVITQFIGKNNCIELNWI